MLRELPIRELEPLLESAYMARIGCHPEGWNCVVPVSYVLSDGALFGHSAPGLKFESLRKNPQVCIKERCDDAQAARPSARAPSTGWHG